MRILCAILAMLLLPITASAQLTFDMSTPSIAEMSIRESAEGIFCTAKTGENSWPIYSWSVNGRVVSANQPLLEEGYASGDSIECTITATNGNFNSSESKSIVASAGRATPLTGAIIGPSSPVSKLPNLLAIVQILGAILFALVLTNFISFRKIRKRRQ